MGKGFRYTDEFKQEAVNQLLPNLLLSAFCTMR